MNKSALYRAARIEKISFRQLHRAAPMRYEEPEPEMPIAEPIPIRPAMRAGAEARNYPRAWAVSHCPPPLAFQLSIKSRTYTINAPSFNGAVNRHSRA